MTNRRRLSVLALALPTWIVMILAGGEGCLMPGSVSARLVAERGRHDVVPSAQHTHAGHTTAPAAAATHDASHPVRNRSHHSGDARTCTAPAACSVAVAPVRWTFIDPPVLPARPQFVSADRPASVAVAPELPPPRA